MQYFFAVLLGPPFFVVLTIILFVVVRFFFFLFIFLAMNMDFLLECSIMSENILQILRRNLATEKPRKKATKNT